MNANRWNGAEAAIFLQDATGKLLEEGCLLGIKNDVRAALLDTDEAAGGGGNEVNFHRRSS